MIGPALTEADAAADLAGTPRPDFCLQPHEQRVIAEYAELVDRMKKLTNFRLGRVVGRLSQLDQELLREQEEAMSRYAAVLSKRIARFDQATDPCTCGPGEGCSNCHPATSPAAEPSRVITPTVGRKVWYFDDGGTEGLVRHGDQPFDATVVYVHDDRTVNLAISDHAGNPFAAHRIHLVQPGDEVAPSRRAEWMPYQVKQAGAA